MGFITVSRITDLLILTIYRVVTSPYCYSLVSVIQNTMAINYTTRLQQCIYTIITNYLRWDRSKNFRHFFLKTFLILCINFSAAKN